tara:strand:+ start:164 stop:637 length:474 start_codon:yes stop_codon:yes gene_type:complete
MKQFFVLFISIFMVSTPLFSAKMYVLSNQATIKSSPTIDGETVVILNHGDEVQVVEIQSIWIKIKQDTNTGWVSKFSLSEDNPLNQSVINQLDKVNLKKNARRRASSYATAATTRGLNEKDGTTVTKSDYDSLKIMESHKPSNEDVQTFIKTGDLNI